MTDKQGIRTWIKQRRAELGAFEKEQMDRAILERLLCLPELGAGAKLPVYGYVSKGGEVDTLRLLEILWQRKIPVAVPRVEGRGIRFFLIGGMEDLEPGCMGILEPVKGCPPAESPASVVLTPGLAFTPQGERIGYGGGFYDRFFGAEPDHERIAAAYPFQILGELPTEEFDLRVHRIVTSEQIYQCGNGSMAAAMIRRE